MSAIKRLAAVLTAAAVLPPFALGDDSFDKLHANPREAVVNYEGVKVSGRAAMYYKEVHRMADELKSRGLDLRESLDVMDDSYAAVWAKLSVIEAVSKSRNVDRHNTHLEQTLMWVDGVMRDRGRNVAIHTHQVFFHHAKNPQSEINEGIRRMGKTIEELVENLGSGGKAEEKLGRIDEVILGFDTRGHEPIKQYLKGQELQIAAKHGKRFRFVYVDELVRVPSDTQAMRAELNALTARYRGQGLQKIIEGVIYSRYVGVLLELKSIEYFLQRGYAVLQSGRELFDAEGMYITELDAVVRGPEGRIGIVEAKSARVPIPLEQALADKVLYKLETYAKHRAALESAVGSKLDDVFFTFDVGCDNEALPPFLSRRESELSKQYALNVKFLFLHSDPQPCAEARRR